MISSGKGKESIEMKISDRHFIASSTYAPTPIHTTLAFKKSTTS